eukprot:530498_1
MQLLVQLPPELGSQTISIDTGSKTTLDHLKDKILDKCAVPKHMQLLIFQSKLLQPDDSYISSHPLYPSALIQLRINKTAPSINTTTTNSNMQDSDKNKIIVTGAAHMREIKQIIKTNFKIWKDFDVYYDGKLLSNQSLKQLGLAADNLAEYCFFYTLNSKPFLHVIIDSVEEYFHETKSQTQIADISDKFLPTSNRTRLLIYGFIHKQYIENYKQSAVSFSTGITWFYWQWYKNRNAIPAISSMNVNDYGGYDVKNLFVKRKYENYKEEILKQIGMEEYQTLVFFKANELMTSDKVKTIKAHGLSAVYHYGINKGEPVTIKHIMSLILYTDFSDYCSKFSASFRKLSGHESLEEVRKRNEEFYWQSKLFREAVEIFGSTGYDKENNPDGEAGPFYTGVDRVLIVPSFVIRLCSPTSTSKQIEVSMNFAKRDGIIIQLNNNGHAIAASLTFFDCSWFSSYNEEDERIFCGGWMSIRIESIRIVENSKNYKLWMNALFILDGMLTG